MAEPVSKAVAAASAVTLLVTPDLWVQVLTDLSLFGFGGFWGSALALSMVPTTPGPWFHVRVAASFMSNVIAAVLFSGVAWPIAAALVHKLPGGEAVPDFYVAVATAAVVALGGRLALAKMIEFGRRWADRKIAEGA